jgi:OTU-like cysteine protease
MIQSRRSISVLLLLSTLLVGKSHSFSALPPPPSSSATSPDSASSPLKTTDTRGITFRSFRLASNGVCIHPRYFQDVTEHQPTGPPPPPPQATTSTHISGRKQLFTMINVPGDGDCMFLAVALAATNSMGWSSLVSGNDGYTHNSTSWMHAVAQDTRAMVAQVLNSPDGWLYISGGGGKAEKGGTNNSQTTICKANELLQQATNQEPGINTTHEYLQALTTPGALGGLYGGGPELTVLANIFRRPISIYELAPPPPSSSSSSSTAFSGHDQDSSNPRTTAPHDMCPIIWKGTFGDGLFDDPCGNTSILPQSAVLSATGGTGVVGPTKATNWHLQILVIDVSPTEKHACVLVPSNEYH